MMIFIDNIPPTSEVVPLIGRYFSCSVFIMGASLVATCVSLSFYYNKPSTEIPFWLRILAFRCLGPALGIRPPKHIAANQEIKLPSRERANSIKGMLLNESNDKRRKQQRHSGISRKLENSSILSQSTSFPNNLDRSQPPVIRVFLESEAARYPPEPPTKNHQSCCCCCTAGQSSEDSELEEKREEWHYVAAVADRFFFYLFLVIICLCALIVFLLSPAVGMMF
jgi:hypothetical protein